MIHENIVHDRNLDLTDLRVYFTLCKIMDPGGWILQTQVKISTECGIAQSNISASMKKLFDAKYLLKERQGKTGRALYRVNPFYTSKGPISMRKSQW